VTGARDYREDLDIAATPLPPLERPGLFVPPEPPRLPPGDADGP